MLKIAIVADIHYADECPHPTRRTHWGERLSRQAVDRLNEDVRPDVVLLPGDLVDEPDLTAAREKLARLKGVFDELTAPWFAIPGNHDPSPEQFYEVIPQPGETADVGGARFAFFPFDPEEPKWNAKRLPEEVERTRTCRGEHPGPIVTLQHVPISPPEAGEVPHNYTNAGEVVQAMREARVTLALGGHVHAGIPLVRHDGCAYLCAPALCEEPFPLTVVEMDETEADGSRSAIRVTHLPMRVADA